MQKENTFVLGDLHCNYKGLIQLLQKTNFNYEFDTLFFVGDLLDGYGNDSINCLLELSKINKFFPCMGNHDVWLKYWLETGKINKTWLKCGGQKTLTNILQYKEYKSLLENYFAKVKYWYTYNKFFICHAGFDSRKSVTNQKEINFTINRSLFQKAIVANAQNKKLKFNFTNVNFSFNSVIIGHTPTISHKPEFISNVINIDTG